MELREKISVCLDKYIANLSKYTDKNGDIKPVYSLFRHNDLKNTLGFQIQLNPLDEGGRSRDFVIIGLYPEDDRLATKYIFEGTSEEIKEFLKAEKSQDTIINACISLDKSISGDDPL